MKKTICVLKGDGIGPEIIEAGLSVLKAIEKRFAHEFKIVSALVGGQAIEQKGEPLPEESLRTCREADATLLGAVGGPKWDDLPMDRRPEKGLLGLRSGLGLFANIRPAFLLEEVAEACLLRPDIAKSGLDLIVVRELAGGIYFGQPCGNETRSGLRTAFNTMIYNEDEIKRIARVAFELARSRKNRVCSVDKANILEVSSLWRRVVEEVRAADFGDVELAHMYVDNAAMQLVRNPAQFDIILTSNLFGDILSDEAAVISGSIGMLPSASLDGQGYGLYEPIHGSAPDIAGQDIANPLGTILSVAMLLDLSFGLKEESECISKAICSVLAQGVRTRDMATESTKRIVGCKEITGLIVQALG